MTRYTSSSGTTVHRLSRSIGVGDRPGGFCSSRTSRGSCGARVRVSQILLLSSFSPFSFSWFVCLTLYLPPLGVESTCRSPQRSRRSVRTGPVGPGHYGPVEGRTTGLRRWSCRPPLRTLEIPVCPDSKFGRKWYLIGVPEFLR